MIAVDNSLELLMPDEVKEFVNKRKKENQLIGYEMHKLLDIDRQVVDKPDGEMDSDYWSVTYYNTISCVFYCKSWCFFEECGERKVVTNFAELPRGLAKKLASKILEVA